MIPIKYPPIRFESRPLDINPDTSNPHRDVLAQLVLQKHLFNNYCKYSLQERQGQQTQSTTAAHNFTLLLAQRISLTVLSFLLDFRNLRLPTTCERWGPLWTTEAICSRVLHRKGDLHALFFCTCQDPSRLKVDTQHLISLQTPDQRSKCSWRIIHSVDIGGRSCQTFHKRVEGRMCAAEAIFENNPS